MLCCVIAVLAIATAQTRKISDAEVQKIHKSALLIDSHNDITSRTVQGYDIGKAKNDGHTNLTALREGGVGAQFFAVYVAASYVNGNR
jgi:membrane dipeptidase